MPYSNTGIPKLSPPYLSWIKGLASISTTQQQRMTLHHSYKYNNTDNRILVDVVIVQKVVEYELTSYQKQRRVNNIIMGAVLPSDEVPILEEMARSWPELEQTKYSSDGFSSTAKKFDILKVPMHHQERREWLDIVNDKFLERLTLREYGYFLRNGDVVAENLVARMPDTIDRYNSVKNTHIPGEYGSIYVYKDDFQSCNISYDQLVQWQQEATAFIDRVKLLQQIKSEEKKREQEEIERKEREETSREDEKIKNMKYQHVEEYIDVL